VSEPSSNPHADQDEPSDPKLTPMETFFDTLFNQHMVLPQPPEDPLAGSALETPSPSMGEGSGDGGGLTEGERQARET